MEKLIDIGYISKIHGYKGQVTFHLDDDVTINLNALKFMFLQIDQKPVPFMLEECREKNNGYLLKFEDVNTEAAARNLVGYAVHVEQDDVEEISEGKFWEQLDGYEVIDSKYGSVGRIEEVMEHSGNIVAKTILDEHEIMLPINEQFVIEVDHEKETILYQAPEGLIELYLEEE